MIIGITERAIAITLSLKVKLNSIFSLMGKVHFERKILREMIEILMNDYEASGSHEVAFILWNF